MWEREEAAESDNKLLSYVTVSDRCWVTPTICLLNLERLESTERCVIPAWIWGLMCSAGWLTAFREKKWEEGRAGRNSDNSGASGTYGHAELIRQLWGQIHSDVSSTGTWRRGRVADIQMRQIASSWWSKVQMRQFRSVGGGGVACLKVYPKGGAASLCTHLGLLILLQGRANQ